MLLNARRCECPWCDLAMLLFTGKGYGKLSKDNSSSAKISTSSRTSPLSTSFPCCRRSGALLACSLAHLLHQDRVFSLPRPGGDRFHVAVS